MTARPQVALVGPTASGKSRAAHAAAVEHGRCEIVALDAMTAYRGMDLATAKPTQQERSEVRYHLVDVVDPTEEMSVRRFQALAATALAEIAERGNVALMVGGSGLYYRAVVDQLEIPPQDDAVRAALADEAASPGGAAALYDELARADPVAASRIDPRNERRVLRALEVVRSTGRSFSSFGEGLTTYPHRDVAVHGIAFDAELVDAVIARRFAEWLDAGLLDEVGRLRALPGGLSRTASQAAGYRQLLDHLDGTVGLDEAVHQAIAATRRLARRQWRWFRRDPRVSWVPNADAARTAIAASFASVHDAAAQLED